jgi:hypothetical protein
MTPALTTAKPVFFPSAHPQPWDACDNCEEEPGDRSFPHVIIYVENGQLLAGTECGQRRFQYAVAGHLALAGIRIGPAEDDGSCELLDPEQIEQAVEALHAAGADVTVDQD